MASAAVEAQDKTTATWQALQDHINNWYHAFDFEALEIALAATVGHYFIDGDPCWLLISGQAGSGKTTLIHALEALPSTHTLGDLTTRSLLSGHKNHKGLLMDIGPTGILLFKDFGTIASKRFDDKLEIASQLREVYDGYLRRDTGANKPLQWAGKITIIAATTPAIESQQAMMHELGERFVTVKWRTGNGIKTAEMARCQRGQEKFIISELRECIKKFCCVHNLERPLPDIPAALAHRIDCLAQMTAILRGGLGRNRSTEIISDPSIEMPTRLAKVMCFIIAAHCHLHRREPRHDDIRLAVRIALDSIPTLRARVYNAIPDGAAVGRGDILRVSGIPVGSFNYHVDDLEALGVLSHVTNCIGEEEYRLTDTFLKLKRRAMPLDVDLNVSATH